MVLNRRGTNQRRDRLLANIPRHAGFDRDEYPAAVGLGVEPGDLSNAGEGSLVAEGAVGAPLVVVVHPVWQ